MPGPESFGSSSSLATCPAAKCQPVGCSGKTCRFGPPVAGRQRPRATSVSRPVEESTSSNRAATWEVLPGRVKSAITVGEPSTVKPPFGAFLTRKFSVPGSFAALAVAQAPPPLTGSNVVAIAGSPPVGEIVPPFFEVSLISPRAIFAQLGARNGPPDGASAGQVFVIAVTPSNGFLPTPLMKWSNQASW